MNPAILEVLTSRWRTHPTTTDILKQITTRENEIIARAISASDNSGVSEMTLRAWLSQAKSLRVVREMFENVDRILDNKPK